MLVLLLIASIQLKTVWEKTFDEPVVDVWVEIDEMTVKEAKRLGIKGLEGKSPNEKVKVPLIKAIRTKNKVLFLDKEGNIKEEMQIPGRLLPAFNKGFFITETFDRESYYYHLKCYDLKGNLIWEKDNLRNPSFLSSDKNYLLSGSEAGTGIESFKDLVLIDAKTGKELCRMRVGSDFWVSKILPSGEVIVFEHCYPYTLMKVYLLNKSGEKLWEFKREIKEGLSSEKIMYKNGKVILYLSTGARKNSERLMCLDKNSGEILWEKILEGEIGYKFAIPKAKNILYVKSAGKAYGIDINNGKTIWRCNYKDGYYIYVSVSSDGKYLLLHRGGLGKNRNKLLLIDVESKTIKKIEREVNIYGRFIKDSNLILLKREDNKFEIIKITKKEGL